MNSVSNVSKVPSASTARMEEEANRAALIAQAAALKERQPSEMKEAQIKAEREQLEIETALAAANARMKVYEECEEHRNQVGMNKPAATNLYRCWSLKMMMNMGTCIASHPPS